MQQQRGHLVVTAVLAEGRSKSEGARVYAVSRPVGDQTRPVLPRRSARAQGATPRTLAEATAA